MKKSVSFQVILCMTFIYHAPCAVFRERRHKEKEIQKCEVDKDSGMKSFLWKVKRDPPAYFFGTIHVPYTRVWKSIPENVKVAFKQSDNVYFELDLTDPYTMTSLANCQLLPHGENLSNILPNDIYMRLKVHLEYIREKLPNWITADQKGKGLYADYLFDVIAGNWERKRPIWVMLLVNSLTESDIKSREIPVLDLYLAQEAERLGKLTGAVEKVKEQCVPLNDLNFSQVVFALNWTLWQHESYRLSESAIPYTTDDLIQHYNCGDLDDIIFNTDSTQVPNLLNSTFPPSQIKTAEVIDKYFRTELIHKRNERMADRVAKLLTENPQQTFFFAFGAGHFLGNNTVIDLLREMNFDIEHVHPDQEIPKLKLHHRNRNKHRNKVHEEFGDLWEQMDEESRMWLERTRTQRRRTYNSDKPFNDLWIRMETPSPSLIQQLSSDNNVEDSQKQSTPYYNCYLCNNAGYLSMSLSHCILYMILNFASISYFVR
ncbi:Metalloprotease TIKI1 [Mactra antiquata]